ncbi:MAG: ornithine carbamoyltransferase [Clostridiales bacterium]|nr:ornithine carbamoyltransferase [Clostridiales bacterium]
MNNQIQRHCGKVRHFLDTMDFSKEDLLNIFELADLLKKADYDGSVPPLLKGATLAMIFDDPSTRTRVSFETAMTDLGGHAISLKPGEIHFGSHEAIQDTARVLSSMCHGIMIRTMDFKLIETLASYSTVPIFNAMSDYNHPTQGIADFMTMREHLPEGKKFDDIHVVFVGDSSEYGIISIETGHMCAALGLRYTIASPPKYSLSEKEQENIRNKMKESGGSLTVTDDVDNAIKDADFIVPDVWTYYGYEDQEAERLAAFSPKYQINMELLSRTPDHCKALHCLPAKRNVEITSEVMDHPTRSIVFQEAENRLHAQRGLLAWFLHHRLRVPDQEKVRDYENKAKSILKRYKP